MGCARYAIVLSRIRCGVSGLSRLGSAVLLLALAGGAEAAQSTPPYYATPSSNTFLNRFTPFADPGDPVRDLNKYWMFMTNDVDGGTGFSASSAGKMGVGHDFTANSSNSNFYAPTFIHNDFTNAGNSSFSSSLYVGRNATFNNTTNFTGSSHAVIVDGALSYASNGGNSQSETYVGGAATIKQNSTFSAGLHLKGNATFGSGTVQGAGGTVHYDPAVLAASEITNILASRRNPTTVYAPPPSGERLFAASELPGYASGANPTEFFTVPASPKTIGISYVTDATICGGSGASANPMGCTDYPGITDLPGVSKAVLPPGYYGKVDFGTSANLYLGEGVYYFDNISMPNGGKIIAYQPNGGRTIVYTNGQTTGGQSAGTPNTFNNVFIGPDSATLATSFGTTSASSDFSGGTMMLIAGANQGLTFSNVNTVWATLSAPTGTISTGNGGKFYGQLFGKNFKSQNGFASGQGIYIPFFPDKPLISYVAATSNVTVTESDLDGMGSPQVVHAVIPLTLSHVNGKDIVVYYHTVAGTARADGTTLGGTKDYADVLSGSGSVTIPAGTTTGNIDISVLGDLAYEGTETFTVHLDGALFGDLDPNQSRDLTVTILENDPLPATVSIADASITEGNSGTTQLNFPVRLLNPSTGSSASAPAAITIKWHTMEGSAKSSGAASDFTAVTAGSTTIAVNGTDAVLPVTIQGDLRYEGNESFQVVIDAVEMNGSPMDLGTSSYKRTTATGTVTNDDALPVLSVNSPSVTEGQKFTGSNAFVVSMDRTSDFSACFDWGTADGTAKSPANYATASGLTLCIPTGSTSVTLPDIATVDDARDNVARQMKINVTNAKINSVTMANASGTGTIADNDPTPSVSFANATSGDLESKTSRSFAVNLSAASGQTVTVNWATANDATAGAKQATSPSDLNFVSNSGTLTFAVGETSKTITVATANDAVVELDETYAITLSVPATGNATLGAIPTHIDTIVNNEVLVSAVAATKVYGAGDPTLTWTVSGLRNGDVLTGSLSRNPGETVGSYAIGQGTLGADPKYTILFTGSSLVITPKGLTVTAAAKSKVYGSADPGLTYAAPGLKTGDALTGSLTRAVGEAVGSYAIGQGTLANPNYTVTYVPANLEITKAALTITAAAKTKVYGSSDPTLSYTTVGLKTGDALTGGLTRATGESVGSYLISSTLTHPNYTITYVGANLTITKLALTITAAAKTKVYGSTDPVLTYTTVGLKTGDALTGTLSRAVGEAVGSYAIGQGTLANPNYAITYVGANLAITKLALTVTADAKSKVYGSSDPGLTYTAPGLKAGDVLTGALSRVAGEAVGTYAIGQGTLANPNYAITYVGANLTITAKSVTVTAEAKSKVYGATDPVLTYTAPGLKTGDALTGSLTRVAGENVGSYAISGSFSNPNYAVSFIGADLTITQKHVAVVADAQAKIYGDLDPTLSYVVTGLEGTDVLKGALTRVAGESVGSYAIAQGSLTHPNYALDFTGNVLTIAPKALTVTADAKSKTYGDLDPALTYSTSAMVGTDTLTGSLSRIPGEVVGTYAIAKGSLANPNYVVTYVGADLSITKKAITLVADAKSKTYGAADPELTWKTSGLLGADVLTGALIRAPGETVGTYAIASSLDNPNYAITFTAADLSIVKAALSLVADAKTKTYGTVDPALTYVATGLKAGDVLTGSLSRVPGETVGTYAITSTLDNPNYAVSYTGAGLSIVRKSLTVGGASAESKVYDGTTDATISGAVLSGVSGTDAVTLVPGVASFESKDAGTGKSVIVIGSLLAGADASNYSLVEITGLKADILPKTLTVTGTTAQDKVYDGTTSAMISGALLSGVVGNDAVTLVQGIASFGTKDVGTAKPVTVSGSVLTGADKSNYVLTEIGGLSASITPREVRVHADAQSKSFGAADPVWTGKDTGLVAGDFLSGTMARGLGDTVGKYAIGQGSLTAGSNYSLTFFGDSLTIRPITVSILDTVVPEDAGDVQVRLILSDAAIMPVTVLVRAHAGTAVLDSLARASDVQLDTVTTYSVSFAPGEMVARFPIRVLNDGRVEPSESFRLELSGNQAVPTGSASVTILDNDVLPVVKITGPSEGAALGMKDLDAAGKVPVTWMVDGTSQPSYDTLVPEGPSTLIKCYTDSWGNSACDSVHVTLDTTAPRVLVQAVSKDTGRTWIPVSATDTPWVNRPDVLVRWISIHDGDTTRHQDPEHLSDTLNLVSRCFTDDVGNRGCGSAWVGMDTVAPVARIVTPPAGSHWSAGQIPMLWTESHNGVTVRHDSVVAAGPAGNLVIKVCSAPDRAGNIGCTETSIVIDPNLPTSASYVDSDHDGRIDQVLVQFPRNWTGELPRFDIAYGGPGASVKSGQTASYGSTGDSSLLVVKLETPFPYGWTSSTLTDLGTMTVREPRADANGTSTVVETKTRFDIKDAVPPVILESRVGRTEDYAGKDTLFVVLSEAYTLGSSNGAGLFEISTDNGATWVAVETQSLVASGSLRILLEPGAPGSVKPGMLIRIAGNVTDISGNVSGPGNTPAVTVKGLGRPDMVDVKGPADLLLLSREDGQRSLRGTITFLASRGDTAHLQAYRPGHGYVSSEEATSVCPDLAKCAVTTLYVNRPSTVKMFVYDGLGTFVTRSDFAVTREDLARIEKDKLDRTRLQVVWNLRNDKGRQVTTGVYLVRMLIHYTDGKNPDERMENIILRYGVKVD